VDRKIAQIVLLHSRLFKSQGAEIPNRRMSPFPVVKRLNVIKDAGHRLLPRLEPLKV
jgi:hypothetical protein